MDVSAALAAAVTAGLLAALAGGAAIAEAARSPFDTIQHTMDRLIDPSADALWGSVGTSETAKGEQARAPRTAAEWRALRKHASNLVLGARLIQQNGLPVGTNGRGLADADTPGTRTAAQIRADIDRDPARFAAAARRLEVAGNDALAAVNSRSAPRLLAAGARIDAACEACHAAYWYPRTRLTLPPSGAFHPL